MPPPRNAPARASQRRNSLQDDAPVRTRAGRGGKTAPSTKSERPEIVPPIVSPTKLSPTITRKTTRSASNISGNSFETAPEVYASFEHPLLMVFGLSREFFDGLKKHHGKLPKERKVVVASVLNDSATPEDMSESEEQTEDESDLDVPIVVQPAPRGGRGGRGRGGRGGRGRGTRARGRGGRTRGGLARTTSPSRASRLARGAAPMFPLTEEDDQPSNQSTPSANAKPPTQLHQEDQLQDYSDSEDENEQAIEDQDSEDEFESTQGARKSINTPGGSPPPGLQDLNAEESYTPMPGSEPGPKPTKKSTGKLPVPKISLSKSSGTHTPRDAASTPTESAVPKLLDPEDDMLSDSDLPEPFIENAPWPKESDCEDRADYLLQTRFKPMTDIQAIIASLTKFPASQRSTETLYALAENAQHILKAWQDEYLMLDARTAPHMHPAKKACNGGRIPIAPETFEDMKEADLYGYIYDPKKLPGCQDPWAQRPGAEKGGRRELRTRRTRDMLESAAASEEEEEVDQEGRPSKRQRRATRKFDGTDTGTGANTPKKHNGWGGARKKGVSRFLSKPGSETPEPEGRAMKRARTAATNLLHQRIQEMREESAGGSSGEEGSSIMDVDEQSDANPKRGRPAGSKNVARRSDFGIKKGPRKKTSAAGTPTPSAPGPNIPPPALNSMSEGQGQFTIGEQPQTEIPLPPSNSAEAAHHTTPRVLPSQEVPLVHPNESSTPDAYMLTAPLSQYTSGYVEETSPASGSRRKPRVKSEKRSQSMTIWWAERKARKREQDEKNGTPTKTPTSRSNSVSRKGPRTSISSTNGAQTPQGTPPDPQHQQQQQQLPSPIHHAQHPPHHAPPEAYMSLYSQPHPGQHYMYVSAPPPPHHMIMQYSSLAALPSGSFPAYPNNTHAPHPHPNAAYGARALAPAPTPLHNIPNYPSPYGPQSPVGKRPLTGGSGAERGGPPALAPAPPTQGQQQQHFSPYAPVGGSGVDRQFKVMVPGPSVGERRGSR
ncbi:hypothetical protein NX059_010623 [Plenodomus lindquistii]|nr:hypothetical protein NX059_010623 [Plenodomus lindquistii]